MRSISLLLAIVGLGAVSACVPGLPSRGPVDLRETDTHVVRFGFKTPRGALCPGDPVDLDLQLLSSDGTRLYPRRFDIEDAIFDLRQIQLTSPQGHFDPEGRFFPEADPRVSAQTGFQFFVTVPRGPSFAARFPPVYECATPFGREGMAGPSGENGDDALFADINPPSPTRKPDAGADGYTGGTGGKGGDGPSFTVYVTWVRTPDYTKLLAARAEGDVEGFALRAPGNPLAIVARGGSGGAGGDGGRGATSLTQNTVTTGRGKRSRNAINRAPGGPGYTQAGRGGTGGVGGEGGHGGNVRIVLDARFDDLDGWVSADAGGGTGGAPGRGGPGGPNRPSTATLHETSSLRGDVGLPGTQGFHGAGGSSSIERGDVLAKFQDLGAIVPL